MTESPRRSGFSLAALFLLIACAPLLRHRPWRPWALGVAAALALAASVYPRALTPLDFALGKITALMQRALSFAILGVLFYLVFTPARFLIALAGKDLLRLRFDRAAASYWIPRDPPGPAPDSLANLF